MKKKLLKSGITIMAIVGTIAFGGCGGGGGSTSKKMPAPVVEQVGNILTWNDVEDATEYLVKFGEQEFYTAKTSCYLENYEQGGKFTVQALQKENGEVVKSSPVSVEVDFPALTYTEDNSAFYDFRTESVVDVSIPATMRKCTIYSDGEYKNFSIFVKERTLPLVVELYNVKADYFGIEGDIRNDIPTSQLVTINSLGETGNEFKGYAGNTGAHGRDNPGAFTFGDKGGTGGTGGDGGRFHNVLITGTQNITFTGGTGGRGGNGGQPGFGVFVYGDGGIGGTGGVGLRAANCFVYMEYATLLATAGAGGDGGAGASAGRTGSVGTDFVGVKKEFSKPLIISAQE